MLVTTKYIYFHGYDKDTFKYKDKYLQLDVPVRLQFAIQTLLHNALFDGVDADQPETIGLINIRSFII